MGSVVDYSYGRLGGSNQSHVRAVAEAGYLGMMRYVSFDGYPKNITRDEMKAINDHGLGLGLVWETTASMMLRGRAGGLADVGHANAQADAIGFPEDRPIYYACDTDVNIAIHGSTLRDYIDATRSGREPGIYGEYDVVQAMVGTGFVRYGWQCAAWSGSGHGSGGSIQGRRLSEHACLFQRVGYVMQNTCDTNDVLRSDWGQHNYNGIPIGGPTHDPDNPDVLVIPTNPEPNPEDEVKRILIDEETGHVYQTWGIFKKYIGTEEEAQFLIGLGAIDARTTADGTPIPGKRALDSLSLVP